jgi:hypothetical protein
MTNLKNKFDCLENSERYLLTVNHWNLEESSDRKVMKDHYLNGGFIGDFRRIVEKLIKNKIIII